MTYGQVAGTRSITRLKLLDKKRASDPYNWSSSPHTPKYLVSWLQYVIGTQVLLVRQHGKALICEEVLGLLFPIISVGVPQFV